MSFSQKYKKVIISFSQKFITFINSVKKGFSTSFQFLNEHKHAKIYFWISLATPIVLFVVLVVILPLNVNLAVTDNRISNESEFLPGNIDVDNIEELKKYSNKMTDLNLEEMFLESQLLIAKNDSISLILDLVDSTLSLSIRGVNIRECQVNHFKMGQMFHHIKGDQRLFDWLSKPFVLQKDWATIEKVPIKIRKAPKDTIEAKKYKNEPVKMDKPDAYYTLQFDRNLIIKVHQVESNSFWGSIRKGYYNIRLYLRMLIGTFRAFFHLNTPRSPLWIELKISKNDALAIYRAIPNQAALALRLHFF
jgi:hypothetical protein